MRKCYGRFHGETDVCVDMKRMKRGQLLARAWPIMALAPMSHGFSFLEVLKSSRLQTLLVFAIFAQIWSAGGVLATITQMSLGEH